MNILFALIAYLIGSFPSGKIIANIHGIEIEKVGSGNIGATNIARNLGKKAGLLTLLLDSFKGFLATILAVYFGSETTILIVSIFVVMGHCFTLPGIKGGKGVATAFGVICALSIQLAITTLLIFVITFWITRIVSISSISAALILPIIHMISSEYHSSQISIAIIGLLITFRHKDNILRIIEGKEPKFSLAPTHQKKT